MKIIKTPWENELMDLVKNSNNSIKMTSPFIKSGVCNKFVKNKLEKTKINLITSFKLKNIYSGSLDLNGLKIILDNKGVIKNYSRLHSKIYIFDDKKAIITSGNLTQSGLLRNYEYGILIEDKKFVFNIIDDFNQLYSNVDAGKVSMTHITEVEHLLSKIPKSTTARLPKYNLKEKDDDYDEVIEVDNHIIESSLSGWKLEVFKCTNNISSQEFSLNEINKYEDYLKKRYPNNQHITAKIRQQLQNLRDLGLIEFLGNGKYKKLWK